MGIRSRILRSNFNGGEVSKRLQGRCDLAKYNNCAETAENILLLPQGGITRRPGTHYVANTKNDGVVRLIKFEFSPTQAFVLEFGASYLRFFTEQGQIVAQPTGAAIVNGGFASGITGWTDASTGGSAAIQAAGGTALVAHGTGTAIGNMTGNGGLAAAFDGTYDQASTAAAARFNSPNCNVGKHWSGTKKIGKFVLNPTTDHGFREGTGKNIHIYLEGSSDNFVSSVVRLYADDASDDQGDYVADSGIDTTTAYAYHRVRMTSQDFTDWYVSEVEFWEVAGTGSLQLVGDTDETAIARQSFVVPTANRNQEHVLAVQVAADIDRVVKVRLGSTLGGTQLVNDRALGPGWHLIAFTPTTSPVYLEFRYDAGDGTASVAAVSLLGSGASAAVPLEIASPWSLTDLPNVRTAQVRDLLYVVDGAHRPYKLIRYGAASWSVQQVFLDRGPFADEDPSNEITVTAGDVRGDITLTADGDLFRPGDVGATWRLCATDGFPGWKSWIAGETSIVSGTTKRISGDFTYVAASNGTTGNTAPVHTKGTVSDGVVDWTFINMQGWGVVLVTGYTSPTSVSARVLVRLDSSVVTDGTTVFRKPAFSDADGWPVAAQMYTTRMIYAKGARFFMSEVGKFDSFDPARAKDDDAIQEELGGEGFSSIAWIRGRNRLLLGTSTGPWVLRSNTLDDPFTPTAIQARAQNASGAASLDAFNADDAVLYFGPNLKRLFELTYQFQVDGYTAAELTETADHILRSGVVEAALAGEPWSSLWCVRGDGQLAVLTYDRAQATVGWSRVIPGGGGVAESVETIPGKGPTVGRDEVWVAVRRTIGGVTRRFVEYLDDIVDSDGVPTDAWFVDAGLAYEGPAVRTVSGLSHLEGQTVAVCADGQDQAQKVVTGGAITLTNAASKVVVGLPCPWLWKGLKLAEGTSSGPGLGVKRKIDHVLVGMVATGNAEIGDGRTWEPVPMRAPDNLMDAAVPLFTGERKPNFPPGWSLDARVHLRGTTTLPATISHLEIQVDTNEAK